jgi:subtilisin family serine protease
MKKVSILLLSLLAAAALSCRFEAQVDQSIAASEEGVRTLRALSSTTSGEGRYLVLFKDKPGKADRDAVKANGASIAREFDIVPAFAIKVPNAKALEGLRRNPNVDIIEEDQILYATAETTPWGVLAVNAPAAWSRTTGDGVKVAVLDTGIDYTHPDLAANYRGGYDFVNDDEDPYDGNGHGTHCSGTIAAITGNGIGVASVAYNVDLYAVKVLSDEGSGRSSDILAGIDWAVKNGMAIASMSLGGGRYSKTEDKAYANAFNAGLLIICATGNDAATTISYPAGYASTMGIGAVDENLAIADFSNTGAGVDVVAPGVDVLSTVPLGMGTVASVTWNGSAFAASAFEYSPRVTGLTRIAVPCGEGIDATYFPAEVAGNIALIQRGTIAFADKVTNAMAAGAAGVIIYNNVEGTLSGTLGAAGDWVPTVSMTMADGLALVAAGSPTVTIDIVGADYDYYSGTSMATPHASAVAALIKASRPGLTNQQVWNAMTGSATDLGAAGYDTIFGYGIVNAMAGVELAASMPEQRNDTYVGTLAKGQTAEYDLAVSGGVIKAAMSWDVAKAKMTLTLYGPTGLKVASGTTALSYDTAGVAGAYRLAVTNASKQAYTATYTLNVTYMP